MPEHEFLTNPKPHSFKGSLTNWGLSSHFGLIVLLTWGVFEKDFPTCLYGIDGVMSAQEVKCTTSWFLLGN